MANKNDRKSTFVRNEQQIAALNNLLSAFGKTLQDGYTDEAWVEASVAYRRLAGYLYPAEREVLGNAWSTMYVTNDSNVIREAIDSVRNGF